MATVTRHQLSGIDRDARVATCSVCGPVAIWVSKKGVDCANKRREIKLRSYRKRNPVERRRLSDDERREQAHLRYMADRDRRLANDARRYRETREGHAEYNRRYYEDHSDRIKQNAKRWAESNRELRSAHNARRRTRLADGMSAVDIRMSADYRRRIADDPCYYCGTRADEMQDDHLIPLARGGTDHWFNLVRACRACNASKRDKMPGEFLAQLQRGVKI